MGLDSGQITKQQKIAIGIIGIIGLFMFYSKVYAPLGDKIKKEEETLEKKQTELEEMKIKAQKLDLLEKEFKLLLVHLKFVEEKLPKTEELPKFIRTITDTAAKYGMDVTSLKIAARKGSQYYTSHPYGMNLESDYHTLGAFFTEVAQLERIFNISNLKMTPNRTAKKGSEIQLNATFSLIAYTAQ